MKENKTPIPFEVMNTRKTIDKRLDLFDVALTFLWGAIIATVVSFSCLVFVEIFVLDHHHAPTHTKKPQPEPTEQYADSLVCPD